MTVINAALHYAARGLAIFPVPPGSKKSYKSEQHSNGRKWGMTRNADEIRCDFTRWPDAGVGIPTGAVNNIVVVETDTKAGGHKHDGEPSLRELEAQHGPLPETLQAISPSGSVHRYFRHPGNGIKIRCSHSELGPGIDIKADGGLVIWWPAHDYPVLVLGPVAQFPTWVKGEMGVTTKSECNGYGIGSDFDLCSDVTPILPLESPTEYEVNYARRALLNAFDELRVCPAGCRNTKLNALAYKMGRLIVRGWISLEFVVMLLMRGAEQCRLLADDGERQCRATIASGIRAGMGVPYHDIDERRAAS